MKTGTLAVAVVVLCWGCGSGGERRGEHKIACAFLSVRAERHQVTLRYFLQRHQVTLRLTDL